MFISQNVAHSIKPVTLTMQTLLELIKDACSWHERIDPQKGDIKCKFCQQYKTDM